ncbi:MAG: AraC family transcriptional regulator [Flavobacteriaceae bacterium]
MFNQLKILHFLLCYLIAFNSLFATENSTSVKLLQIDSLITQHDSTKVDDQKRMLVLYEKALDENHSDSVNIFKKVALLNAELNHPGEAFTFTEKYINNALDFSVLGDSSYQNIIDSEEYKILKNKYQPKINILAFIYFYIALIGFYFAIVINFTRKARTTSNLAISLFIAVHSLFILEFVLYYSNLQYELPHTYFMAAGTALMYGPLLYLYFKSVTQNYKLKTLDILHFYPTVLVLLFLLPIYTLPASEKIKIMLDFNTDYKFYGYTVFALKLSSLIIYGVLISRMLYLKQNEKQEKNNSLITRWKKSIYFIHVTYIISYLIYGISISGILGFFPSFIYHVQVIAICIMVLYVAYMAYVQPDVFSNKYNTIKAGLLFQKYENSGLTESLSEELKASLIKLFVEDKIYRENNLSLEMLSEKLNTTRHNTSQIINEHFNMNFFELINKFRIEEVTEILKKDIYGSLHIIDIAYEVGYNNKVTFNKAFKKETSLTPSQFIQAQKNKPLVN